MAIKPTGIPDWANGAGVTNLAEPLDSKKAVGWSVGEQPASSYENWLKQKTGSWLRYLSYDRLIEEDFVRSSVFKNAGVTPSGLQATGFVPHFVATGRVYLTDEVAAAGVAVLAQNWSGYAGFEAQLAGIGQKDFMMEWVVAKQAGGGSGGNFNMGLFPVAGVGTGPGIWWTNTGLSGTWFVHFGYSHLPSSIDTGVRSNLANGPATPSLYQHLTVERIGATLVAEIDGTRVAAYGGANSTAMQYMDFGIRTVTTTGYNYFQCDRVALGVRRA